MATVTPYELGFDVRLPAPGELRKGGDFHLRATLRRPPTDEAVTAYGATLTAWGLLASTGAMCGEHIEAARSGIDDWGRPVAGVASLDWRLVGVRLDDRATVVLAHMLRADHVEHPLVRLDLAPLQDPAKPAPMAPGGPAPMAPTRTVALQHDPAAWDVYPGIDRSIRFALQLSDQVMETAYVRVELSAVPTEAQRAAIRDELLVWGGAASLGGYGIAPAEPEQSGFVAPDDLQFVDEELEWSLSSFQAHAGAIVALTNVVSAIHQRVLPVRSLVVK